MKILVTGTAGFIGHHLALRLLRDGHEVVGIDNLNDYYDPRLKYGRLAAAGIDELKIGYGLLVASSTPGQSSAAHAAYRFARVDLTDYESLQALFAGERFDAVCNLAAQAGVRYSLENPHAYADSNLTGFLNILELCRRFEVGHLVYASSSSVYGMNTRMPFSTKDPVDYPVSLYAASKKANELMAHSYSHLYSLPTTGLRFFTVYGPWGRPDMAYFLFTDAIMAGRPIKVFNNGEMKRDFTYIDDIVEGVARVLYGGGPTAGNQVTQAPYRIYNIGNGAPVDLMQFIEAIEKALGKTAEKEYLPMQPGDVPVTWADTTDLERDFGYKPSTPVEEGVARFVEWYREYYGFS
ncbi:MAG: NAD-dependent epimerase [Spirochaetaceae bacterium]|nr:NAD-dependent epimerase [Spirochaetaceae bacterium]